MPVVSSIEVDNVVCAVRAIHDGNVPNSERVYFTQQIEFLKDSSPISSIDIAFQLVKHDDQCVRQVGWNIIEHIIRYKWVEIGRELRLKIRNGVLEYMSLGQFSLGFSDSIIKTSISRAIVYMMENEWPQNWPELFPQFEEVLADQKLFAQSQMVFIILKRLIENVITLPTIEDQAKRNDLSCFVHSYIGDILNMCIVKIRGCIADGMNENSVLLAKSAINLLYEIVEWVSNKILEDKIESIVDVVCAYLQTDMFGIYEEAAKCLWKIASRKNQKPQETPVVISMFRDVPMRTILCSANLASEVSSSSIQHYKYLKALCNLLCALGVHLSDVWLHIGRAPPNFNMYLSAISAFFVHPSIYIRAETAQVLSTFSGHEKISKDSDFNNCIVQLFQHLPRCLERAHMSPNGDQNANLADHYSRMDYENDDEFVRDNAVLRERCCKIIRENTVMHFENLLVIINDWIVNRFLQQTENIGSEEFDTMKRFITTFLTAAYQFGAVTPDFQEISKSFSSIFDAIFTRICAINDPKTLNGSLSILSAFFVVLNDFPDKVPTVFSKLKILLMLENVNNEDLDILTLKRHCIALFLKIVSSYPKAVKPYAQTVLDVIVEVSSHVTVMQWASLVHVLAALSNLAESPETQHMFLQNATEQNIQYFKSNEFLTCISSAANFFTYIGLSSQAPKSEFEAQTSAYYENRLALKSHLSAVEGCLQHVNLIADDKSNPLFPLLQPIIPNFFQLARCINSLYNVGNTRYIHNSYGPKVLDITPSERQIVYFSMLETELKEQTSESPNDALNFLRRYIFEMGELVQSVLGLMGAKLFTHFYQMDNIVNGVGSGGGSGFYSTSDLLVSTLDNMECVPDCRLRFWIRRTWSKLICCCPPEKSDVVVKLIVDLTVHLHSRISDRWEAIRSRSKDPEPTDEELFLESVCSVLCREYAIMLKNFVLGEFPTHKVARKDSGDVMDPLARALFSHKEILDNVMVSLIKLINCPDAQAAIKAVPVANVIIGNFYNKFDEQMGMSMLIHTIQSLQVHGTDEVIVGPLLSLIYTIYSLLRPIYPSLVNVLNQVPGSAPDNILNFDNKVMTMFSSNEKLIDKNKRDLMRKILKPVIALNIGEQHRRPVQLRRVV